ncbi:MAG: 16S rRNA (guanine(966)-N(2))-methyltransferase RsmD [Spirochaetia bacterium]
MRITGGQYKSLRVVCPPGEIRPAMDRMRESMFSILGEMEGVAFLDLFAGSGVMALEAASRGATDLWLVEKDRRKEAVIKKNMQIAINVDTQIRFMDVLRFIKKLPRRFDFIHLDPPFPMREKIQMLAILATQPQVDLQTVITIHYPQEDALPEKVGTLKRYDLRKYGRSLLGFYSKN